MNRPTILLVAPTVAPPYGGYATAAESVIESLATFAAVRVITRSQRPRAAEGVRVFRGRRLGLGGLLDRLRFIVEVIREARARDVAGVHVVTWSTGTWIWPFLGRRLFVVHCFGSELLRVNRLSRVLRNLVLARADLIVAISRYTAEVLRSECGRAAEVVYLGVHPPAEAATRIAQSDSGVRVLSVARFVPRKGHLGLVRAIAELRSQGCDCTLVIAGASGPELPRVRALRDELRAHAWIELEPDASRERLSELYAQADVFALLTMDAPGEFEGFGLVFVEAALAGLPVVAGRSGGSRDAVADSVSGFLVQGPDDARDRLRLLCSDAALRLEMGGRAARFGQRFLHAAVDEELAALYAAAWRRTGR